MLTWQINLFKIEGFTNFSKLDMFVCGFVFFVVFFIFKINTLTNNS